MSSSDTRIYRVIDTFAEKNADSLVRASNAAQAVRHVVGERFTVSVAEQQELVDLVSRGVKVQAASNGGSKS